jgi:hypothetical protein
VARSVRLFRAFRTEQADPAGYYAGLARDTARQLGQYADLDGLVVADVPGAPRCADLVAGRPRRRRWTLGTEPKGACRS